MINTLKQNNAALLIIDVQKGFSNEAFWGGKRNNPLAEQNCGKLLSSWRDLSLPIFHIQHKSDKVDSLLHPNNPGFNFQEIAQPLPDEPVIVKSVNSAFIGTELKKKLSDAHINTLVIAGLTTDHCVSTTTRMAGNLGFKVYLIADACATFPRKSYDGTEYDADSVHNIQLASIHNEFATVCTITDILSETKIEI